MKVLVLGISGMLGSMVFDYFSKHTDCEVYGTVRTEDYVKNNVFLFDAHNIGQLERETFTNLSFDYLINCIGITKPFSRDDDPEGVKRAIAINSRFPWELAEYTKERGIKVIQIGTDCVFSGNKGLYDEEDPHDPLDVYGKSKSLGEVFDGSALIIRNSIIGPEVKEQKYFLLEWFLNQPKGGTIGGFEHHTWNGVTTLQFAELCTNIISKDIYDDLLEMSHVHHYIPNNVVTKYELMNIFNEVFERDLIINKINKPAEKVDRTLSSKYELLASISEKLDMSTAIRRLKHYMENDFNL
jgi:dTDP-4-dehydrorhamnose reductase